MGTAIGRIKTINIHTVDMDRSVKFWTEVLGRTVTSTYSPYAELKVDGEITIVIEKVSDPLINNCGIHFDIKVLDLDRAIERVCKLGGAHVEMKKKEKWSWAIMKDPDGNVFCLCD